MKIKKNVLVCIRRTQVKLQCEHFLNVSEVQQFFEFFSPWSEVSVTLDPSSVPILGHMFQTDHGIEAFLFPEISSPKLKIHNVPKKQLNLFLRSLMNWQARLSLIEKTMCEGFKNNKVSPKISIFRGKSTQNEQKSNLQ